MKEGNCLYCNQDTAFNHEQHCPLHPSKTIDIHVSSLGSAGAFFAGLIADKKIKELEAAIDELRTRNAKLERVMEAADDAERTLSKLARSEEILITGSDIGATCFADRLGTLRKALDDLKDRP